MFSPKNTIKEEIVNDHNVVLILGTQLSDYNTNTEQARNVYKVLVTNNEGRHAETFIPSEHFSTSFYNKKIQDLINEISNV